MVKVMKKELLYPFNTTNSHFLSNYKILTNAFGFNFVVKGIQK